MNASPSGYVTPSTVTLYSFIACSSAACVFGGVRLISLARRISVKIGPCVNVKLLVWKLNRLVPSRSPGIISGVNWIRPNRSDRLAAKHCASSVLAVPGTPSSRMWPPHSRLVSISSMTSSWPTTALRISLRMPSVIAETSRNSIEHVLLPAMNRPCLSQQRAEISRGGGRDPPQQLGAAGSRATSCCRPVEPLGKLGLAEFPWSTQLPARVLQYHAAIAPENVRLISGMIEQGGRIADQVPLAGLQHALRMLRRPEAAGCRQQQKHDARSDLHGDQIIGEFEQEFRRARRRSLKAVQRLVENELAVPAAKHRGDHRVGECHVVALADAVILDRIGIRQHPDPAAAFREFAEQDAFSGGDQRFHPRVLDELQRPSDGRIR